MSDADEPDVGSEKRSFATFRSEATEKSVKSGVSQNAAPKTPGNENAADNETQVEVKKKKVRINCCSLFYYADRLDHFLMFLGTIFAMAGGITLPWHFYLVGTVNQIVANCVNAGTVNPQNWSDGRTYHCMEKVVHFKYMWQFGGLLALMFFGTFLQDIFWRMTALRQMRRIRIAFFRALLSQDQEWYDTQNPTALVNHVASTMIQVSYGLGSMVGMTIFKWSLTAGCIGFGVYSGWEVALPLNCILLPGNLIRFLVINKLGARLRKKADVLYTAGGKATEEALGGIRIVWAFNAIKQEYKRYVDNITIVAKFAIKSHAIVNVCRAFAEFIVVAGHSFGIYWFIKKHDQYRFQHRYEVKQFFHVYMTTLQAAYHFGHGINGLENIFKAGHAMAPIMEIILHEPKINSLSENGKRLDSIKGDVEFNNVTFAYPTRPDLKILDNVSFKIQATSSFALIGESGCGKTTVIQLLLRLYDPTEGSITLDGVDLRDLNPKWLRQTIGLVPQCPVLFSGSIRRNIMSGNQKATVEEMKTAAKMANIHAFAVSLPEGYDSSVGDRGGQLSGGQRQRVAVARALIKRPTFLILDEATSALDNQSEKIVKTALAVTKKGRTTFTIAHKVSTVQTADVIAVLEEGKIMEQGSHAELMNKKGVYFTLCQQQGGPAAVETDLSMTESKFLAMQYVEERRPSKPKPKKKLNSSQMDQALAGARRMSLTQGNDKPSINQVLPERFSDEKNNHPSVEIIVPEEEEVKHNQCSIMSRLLKVNKPECCPIMLGMFAVLMRAAQQPLVTFFVVSIMGVVTTPPEDKKEMKKRRQHSHLEILLCLGLAAGVFVGIVLSGYLLGMASEKLTRRMRELAYWSMLKQDQEFFDMPKNKVSYLTTLLSKGASLVQGASMLRMAVLLEGIFAVTLAIVISFLYSWQISILSTLGLPLLMMGHLIQARINQPGKEESENDKGERLAIEALQGIRSVARSAFEEQLLSEYEEHMNKHLKREKKLVFANAACYGYSNGFIGKAINYSSLFTGIYLLDDGQLRQMYIYIAILVYWMASEVIIDAGMYMPNVTESMTASINMIEVIDHVPKIDNSYEGGFVPKEPCTGRLGFHGILFRYPSRPTTRVIDEMDVDVPPGETLALVGASGGGKSTTIKLLERFYDPIRGDITLDGRHTKTLKLQYLRSQIGYVAQEPTLFSGTIKQNIMYGEGADAFSFEDVESAARTADCYDFIQDMPKKFDTELAGGDQLSAGHIQRIAIARALLKQPRILLLDEATSALDTNSEKIVQAALDKAMVGRTCITIAHRLSTIRNAHNIAVIGEGKILEMGNHDALMGKKGVYFGLVNAKAS